MHLRILIDARLPARGQLGCGPSASMFWDTPRILGLFPSYRWTQYAVYEDWFFQCDQKGVIAGEGEFKGRLGSRVTITQ